MSKLKKSVISLILLIVLSFIGYGVGDFTTNEPVYDESAFEEDLYEIEGEELMALEDESFFDEEMTELSDEEMVELESADEDLESEELEDEDMIFVDLDEEGSDIEAGDISLPDKDGTYTSKEDVAAYIHAYGELPSNYITKKEAQSLGWNNADGNLDEVAPGKSIGGDKFGNYEGMLPEEDGRQYYECDIDFDGGYRNSKRIVYSNDGMIFYTEDHYETFMQLY